MVEQGATPRVSNTRRRALKVAKALTTPLLPDDYIELMNPMWTTRELRGQIEELSRTVAELQRKQSDIAQGVEERMRRIEPQKVTHEGREFNVDPDEKRQYDEALAVFRRGDFERAQTGFGNLLRRWPQTGYRDSALFWQGNAQYAAKQYKEAITTFRTVVSNSPDSPHAPESLLAIANCQAELKDAKAARLTIAELVKAYPKSEAAQAGRDRLVSLR